MLYVYCRDHESKTYEVRLADDGAGYELIVRQDGREFAEHFGHVQRLFSREHELVGAWRALGWTDTVLTRPDTHQHRLRPEPLK